ncbi:MAG: FeoB-associated Cys-rich membrane protein [Ruminococcaceae bacterium]|nr:FeoB-associated Cys-rich membrane protein [Oscillospiraceae bacterium]
MPPWLGTTIVLLLVGAMIGGIIYKLIRDRKAGKNGCSCGCEHCAMQCHIKKIDDETKE